VSDSLTHGSSPAPNGSSRGLLLATPYGQPYPGPTGYPTSSSEAPDVEETFVPDDEARSANLVVLSLFVSLLGFLVVAGVLYEFKFHGVTDYFHGVPTRLVFAFGILLAAAPFLATIVRRVPLWFLVPPLVLLFFLYPIFSPFGIPYDRDPVFLYQFARTLLTSGVWSPGNGVSEQAIVYSYYPGGATFIAESASLTSIPLSSSFTWSTELFRFLVIPPIVYALTARLLNPKAAALAVLLYVVEPSIEMNVPTQQDFAVTFFLLSILLLGYLAVESGADAWFLRLSLVMSTALVVVSHHVTTYLLVGFLAGFALIPRLLRRPDPSPNSRSTRVFVRTLAFAVLWGLLIALPVLQQQGGTLVQNVSDVFHPGPATTSIPGASFPDYEIALIALGILATGILAVLALLWARRNRIWAFVTLALMTAVLVALLSIPFLSTGFSFLALREFEYTGIILAPISAWWIVTRLAPGAAGRTTGSEYPGASPVPASGPSRFRRMTRAVGHPRVAVALAALFVVSGVLVPLSTRDQFAPVQEYQIDSPMFITPTVYSAVEWAAAHLSPTHEMWGDYLAYTAFGGFDNFRIMWDSYALFNGTWFSSFAISRLDVNSYVVIDSYMTEYYSSPMFWGPGQDQPSAVLTHAELAKFQDTAYFSLIYVNPVITIYIVTTVPPAG
jgi:hypothetical protein